MSLPILTDDPQNPVIFYLYTPSDGAAYALLSIFALTTVAHAGYMFHYRTWYFCPLVLGGISERCLCNEKSNC